MFYEICKSRGLKVITHFESRLEIDTKSSLYQMHSSRIYLGDQLDPCLPLPNRKNTKRDNKPSIIQQSNSSTDKKLRSS